MNKKGFTLIELLAVIVVLSLVITIVATKGFGAFDNAKGKLTELDNKTIIESAKMLMTEIQFCDEKINEDLLKNGEATDFSKINDIEDPTCDKLIKKAKDEGLIITLDYLIENNYVTGSEIEKQFGEGIEYKGKFNVESDSITGIEIIK